MRISYHSTNRFLSRQWEKVNFATALLRGIAPDEGLYMPDGIPSVSIEELNHWRDKSYAEVAFEVLYKWLQDDIAANDLATLTQLAYPFSVPIEKIEENLYVARLDQGPTASFKDFAAQLMARLMQHFHGNSPSTILVATSGDTGSAVGAAFGQLPHTRVVILYPEQEVSIIQKKQLQGLEGNVISVAIDGKFDDCQHLVKKAFADASLAHLYLTSANSINIGRVLPQMVYYFYAWLQVTQASEEWVTFCVPSGNLGNSLGAEMARRMGLPVRYILVATNANCAFTTFLAKGMYQKISPSIPCISNAMNVGNPSNLARYFDLYNGTVDKEGKVHRMPDIAAMRAVLRGYPISDETTLHTLRQVYEKYQVILEPHGAVGIAACWQFMKENPTRTEKIVCMETAHPAKFAEIIENTLQITPKPPATLLAQINRTGKTYELPADYESLRHFLLRLLA